MRVRGNNVIITNNAFEDIGEKYLDVYVGVNIMIANNKFTDLGRTAHPEFIYIERWPSNLQILSNKFKTPNTEKYAVDIRRSARYPVTVKYNTALYSYNPFNIGSSDHIDGHIVEDNYVKDMEFEPVLPEPEPEPPEQDSELSEPELERDHDSVSAAILEPESKTSNVTEPKNVDCDQECLENNLDLAKEKDAVTNDRPGPEPNSKEATFSDGVGHSNKPDEIAFSFDAIGGPIYIELTWNPFKSDPAVYLTDRASYIIA